MNFISVASELINLLNDQISILNAITSLNGSLEKLLHQKSLPEKWPELNISIQPKFLFLDVIDSKSSIIKNELKRLRYFKL